MSCRRPANARQMRMSQCKIEVFPVPCGQVEQGLGLLRLGSLDEAAALLTSSLIDQPGAGLEDLCTHAGTRLVQHGHPVAALSLYRCVQACVDVRVCGCVVGAQQACKL